MIFKKFFMVIGLMLFMCNHPIYADDDFSKEHSDCLLNAIATVDVLNCISDEHKHQDTRLNKVYKEIMRNLSDEGKKQLRNAQRLWLKYRSANCDFYGFNEKGSMGQIIVNECYLRSTVERTDEIEILTKSHMNQSENITNSNSKSSCTTDLVVKGLCMGMSKSAFILWVKEEFGEKYALEIEKNETKSGNISGIMYKFNEVKELEYIIISPPIVNKLFKAHQMDIKMFAEKFMDAYHIPQFTPLLHGYGYEYTSPMGSKVKIFNIKTLEIMKTHDAKTINDAFN